MINLAFVLFVSSTLSTNSELVKEGPKTLQCVFDIHKGAKP